MYRGDWKSKLRVNVSNVPGWRTKRHIVVIESDDWGSIRMSSLESFERMLKAGMREDRNHYNTYDALESNADLEELYSVLSKYKDSTGRHPVMTGVNVVANPIFEKIKESGYQKYYYEPYTETCQRYPNHERVYDLWKEGIEKRLFVPIFHGREHLNVQRWLRALRDGNKSTLLAFENGVTGIYNGINEEPIPEFQAAFDLDTMDDLPYMKEVLSTGLALFEKLYGYKAKYFVPTNGPFNNTLENDLLDAGIQYINTGKKQREPLGNGQYKVNTRFLGDKNELGQIYLTRNCFFEPSCCGYSYPTNYDWLNYCLKEIEIAFRWHKPATISSHRVNYIGYLHPENREKGLKALSQLIGEIIKRWPDVEFMTSVELGDLIASTQK
ncbi:hypothetical protein [Prevotella sp. E13-27]|uniref:hypothetical protein n=1 Tax=Prevotella sp. E13-27 TaxID=2938122 RepID=UPI00200A7DBB|nr:hypothetical protein [Prevotella sp. E13-27]MCK8623638.1 hypothetical protein [Prevotella sp. E13-27]